jgi:hypothetical protein
MENNSISIVVPPIKLKNSLKSHFHYETVKNAIEDELKKIPALKENFRMSAQLTLMVCDCLEKMISNNKKLKIDKKALVVLILGDIFDLTDSERLQIEEQIEFLHDSKAIKAVTIVSKIVYKLNSVFC